MNNGKYEKKSNTEDERDEQQNETDIRNDRVKRP